MPLTTQNVYPYIIENTWLNLLLLIYILINTLKECYHWFAVNLDRCVGSCNTRNDLIKVWVSSKTEDLNLSIFNMITRINES